MSFAYFCTWFLYFFLLSKDILESDSFSGYVSKVFSGLCLVFFFSLWFISKSSFWYFCLLRQCLLFLDNTFCENILIKVVNTGFRFAFMFKTLIHLELIFWILGTVKMQFQNNFPDGYPPPLSHHHLFYRPLPSQCKMMQFWLYIVSICCLFLSLFSFPLVNVSISDLMPKKFNY